MVNNLIFINLFLQVVEKLNIGSLKTQRNEECICIHSVNPFAWQRM